MGICLPQQRPPDKTTQTKCLELDKGRKGAPYPNDIICLLEATT